MARAIPGIRNRIPGARSARMRTMPGGFRTRVPRQPSSRQFSAAHRTQLRDVSGRFAGGWGFAWQGIEAAGKFLENYESSTYRSIEDKMQDLSEQMVAYAKENAPWQDRTTNARSGLQGGVVQNSQHDWTLWLGHGDDIYYGIWLEVRWGGKFAIIQPTLVYFTPIVAAELGGGR
jgi:hypothetical protein